MSLAYYNPQERYRKRAAERIAGFAVVFCVLGLSVGLGFWFGKENAAQENSAMHHKVTDLEERLEQANSALTELRAREKTATARLERLQRTMQETVPEGPVEDLLALVRKQLEEGRDPERLAFLIRSARPPRNCVEPQTVRFVVSTPAYKGPDSAVTVADGTLTIKASGASARNEKGQAEAWYDPSKEVTLEFLRAGGEKDTKKGGMPLQHSMVVDGREYRFTVSEGARSFAKVTFDSCDYP
ncbi:MAG: hypothetical protein KDJ75_01180 [Alphaproteobacteria bacterium]|nr:hypothetical protein [Alphaproteobacteria bacterium]